MNIGYLKSLNFASLRNGKLSENISNAALSDKRNTLKKEEKGSSLKSGVQAASDYQLDNTVYKVIYRLPRRR